MSRIRLYFDEDAIEQALVVALRARRIDVLTAFDCGMIGKSDEDHLNRGIQQRYSVGEQLRRLLHLLNRPAADMLSRLEYLSTWGQT